MRASGAVVLVAVWVLGLGRSPATAGDPELRQRPRPAATAPKPRPKPKRPVKPRPAAPPSPVAPSPVVPSPVVVRPAAVSPAVVRAVVVAPPPRPAPQLTGRWRYVSTVTRGVANILEVTTDGRVRGTFHGDDGIRGTLDGTLKGDHVHVTTIVKVLFLKVRTVLDGTLSLAGPKPRIAGTFTGDAASGTFSMEPES